MLSTGLFIATVMFDEGRRPLGSPAFRLLDFGRDAAILFAEHFFNGRLTLYRINSAVVHLPIERVLNCSFFRRPRLEPTRSLAP